MTSRKILTRVENSTELATKTYYFNIDIDIPKPSNNEIAQFRKNPQNSIPNNTKQWFVFLRNAKAPIRTQRLVENRAQNLVKTEHNDAKSPNIIN